MGTIGETSRYRIALGAALAVLAALALPAVLGQVYAANDLGIFHLPLRHFYAQCLKSGEDFAWFPGIYCGFPLHGEGQLGMYHPFHLALYSALPFGLAFNLEFLASYVVLLTGVFAFLRRWELPRDASLFGAIIFAFGGYNAGHYFHMNSVAIIAHLPWLLAAIDVILRGDDPRRAAWARFAVSALTASQLLLGHPQSVWFSAMVEGLYCVFLLSPTRTWARKALGLAIAKGLGILAGAVQLLPTAEAVANSQREEITPAFKAMGSLPPGNLVQSLAPYLYVSRVFAPSTTIGETPIWPANNLGDWRVYEFGLYNGAIIPVLLAWLWLRRAEIRPRRLAIGAGMLAALALILSFGEFTPLFRITSNLPGLRMFRLPARYLVVFHLATAILAASAFADLAGLVRERAPRWKTLLPLLLIPLASLVIAVSAVPLSKRWPETLLRHYYAPTPLVVLGVALIAVATSLVLLAARGRRWALPLIILFAAGDEAYYALTFVYSAPPSPIKAFVDSRPAPPTPTSDRVRSFDNILTLKGTRLVEGYAALTPKRHLNYGLAPCLRVAGASWMVPKPDSVDWAPVADTLPRARLVSNLLEWPTPSTAMHMIDPVRTAIVPGPLHVAEGPSGVAKVVSDRPGKIHVVTIAPTRQLLVLTERVDKGWHATVDGQPRKVVPVYGDFLGCVVDPGTHRVSFRYQPWSFRLGGRLSLAGLALMGGWLGLGLAKAGPRKVEEGRP